MTISKSPKRHTFQAENYVIRCEEKGQEPSEDYLNMFKSVRQQDDENMIDPNWQKNNMEYDLRSTDWILTKVRESDSYAQNLYAAICNNEFCKREMWPILKEEYWSASWRSAGGIIADMQEKGDYIDWYCSGMGGLGGDWDKDSETFEQWQTRTNYVSEATVTEEIRIDFQKLGWIPSEWPEDSD